MVKVSTLDKSIHTQMEITSTHPDSTKMFDSAASALDIIGILAAIEKG